MRIFERSFCRNAGHETKAADICVHPIRVGDSPTRGNGGRLHCLLVLGLWLAGCGGLPNTPVEPHPPVNPQGDRPGEEPTFVPVPISEPSADGAALYHLHCVHCHGVDAVGASAPAIRSSPDELDGLVSVIEEEMPLGNASACEGECANAIAQWIRTLPPLAPSTCAQVPRPKPRVRLLTRQELLSSLQTLLPSLEAACVALDDCEFRSESCVQARCQSDACDLHTFVYHPDETTPSSVSVAGDFNQWNPADPQGQLTWDAGIQAWVLKRQLPTGSHAYKFVLNGVQWISDPSAENFEDDGYGGSNSLALVTCAENGAEENLQANPAEWISHLPPETRPPYFPFDTHGGGLATVTFLDEVSRIAHKFAASVALQPNRFLGCAPTSNEDPCLRTFVADFASTAWRRLLANDEVDRLHGYFVAAEDVDAGLEVVVRIILSSPDFLYRSEVGEVSEQGVTLTQDEIASALSFFITGGPPDEILRTAAANGTLTSRSEREQQARRLLSTEAARQNLGRFVMQWLGAERVLSVDKDMAHSALFDISIRHAMAEETQRFFQHVLFDATGELRELYTSTQSMLSEDLAAYYGAPFQGAGYALTSMPNHRSGVLGQGSVLASYAYSAETAPVRRGLFVRERLLCQDLGTPPPNAGAIPEVDNTATTRERFAQHTEDSFCYACHQYIDPIGFGFEAFDAIGRYREMDNGLLVDASGDMNDVEGLGVGTSAPFSTLAELGDVLASSDAAAECFVRQMHRFGYGWMPNEPEERCATESLRIRFRATGQNIRELVVEIVAEDSFIARMP